MPLVYKFEHKAQEGESLPNIIQTNLADYLTETEPETLCLSPSSSSDEFGACDEFNAAYEPGKRVRGIYETEANKLYLMYVEEGRDSYQKEAGLQSLQILQSPECAQAVPIAPPKPKNKVISLGSKYAYALLGTLALGLTYYEGGATIRTAAAHSQNSFLYPPLGKVSSASNVALGASATLTFANLSAYGYANTFYTPTNKTNLILENLMVTEGFLILGTYGIALTTGTLAYSDQISGGRVSFGMTFGLGATAISVLGLVGQATGHVRIQHDNSILVQTTENGISVKGKFK